MTAPARSRLAASKARSSSLGTVTARLRICRPSLRPAASVCLNVYGPPVFALDEFQRTATCDTVGSASLRSSSRLPPSSAVMLLNPVIFPPGRARFVTTPGASGSATFAETIGIVFVAVLAARARTRTPGRDQFDLGVSQLARKANKVDVPLGVSRKDGRVLAVDVAKLAQALDERRPEIRCRSFGWRRVG